MRQRHHHSWFGLVYTLGVICACGGARTPARISPNGADPCVIAPRGTAAADSVSIAVIHELDGHHAPLPTNASERMVFRQLYETLVRLDCNGQVRPGLADSWTGHDDGQVWTFAIRKNARFWDGSSVTARDVRASWLSHRTSPMGVSIRAVLVVSDRSVVVTFNSPLKTFPTMFAHPAFAVVKENPNSEWPIGTGPYLAPHDSLGPEHAGTEATILRPTQALDAATRPVLSFVRVGQRDGRDVLDRDIDVVVTRDPRVIEYASGGERFHTIALPWDRTYLIVSSVVVHDTVLVRELIDERADLARRAVTAEAESASDWFGAAAGQHCELVLSQSNSQRQRPGPSTSGRRIVYEERDPVARSLAERIVAKLDPVFMQREDRRLAATPLTPSQFADALEGGGDFAYIVAVPRRPLAPCHDVQAFVSAIPWLGAGGDPATVTLPLVDTRPRLIVREAIVEITTEWDGTLVFSRDSLRPTPDAGQRE